MGFCCGDGISGSSSVNIQTRERMKWARKNSPLFAKKHENMYAANQHRPIRASNTFARSSTESRKKDDICYSRK